MKILDSCYLFYRLYRLIKNDVQLLAKDALFHFYDIAFIEKMQNDLSDLKETVNILHQWNITPEIFDFDILYSEQQLVESAKELVGVIYGCIDDKFAAMDQNIFNHMIECMSEEEKEEVIVQIMEKYLKAASIFPNIDYEERKRLFIYAFEINEEKVSGVLSRLENQIQRLTESRNAFLMAAVSWKVNRANDEDRTVFVKEDQEKNVRVEEQTESILSSDAFNDFYQIMGLSSDEESVEEEDREEESAVRKEEVTIHEEEELKACEKKERMLHEEEPTVCGEEEPAVQMEEESTICENEKRADHEEELSVRKKGEPTVCGEEEPAVQIEEESTICENEKSAVREKTDPEECKRETLGQQMQSDLKKKVRNEEKERASVCEETHVHKMLDAFYKKCSQVLQGWMDQMKRGEKVLQSEEGETDHMCWEMLLKGEYMLAREVAATFPKISSQKCVDFTVMDVIGSGLFMPVTKKSTQDRFLSCQPLLQYQQLEKWEQTAVVLAAIPIAHCCFEVQMDSEMLQALPEVFRKWAGHLVGLRKEITYIDKNVIESYRLYQVRIKKLESIREKARQQFEGMQNANIQYELANRILDNICNKNQCIGILWEFMREMDLEFLALGTVNSDVEELYRKGRVYIPEKRSTQKSIDEGLINKIIEDGRKNCGFKNIVQGGPRNKMKQMIGEFLSLVNEWLELIGSPCDYNRYDSSAIFIQKLSESYQSIRIELNQDIEKQEGGYLSDIYKKTLDAMDYLLGLREEMPRGCKSDLEHFYRLCVIPNLYIKKNEQGIYQCKCQDPFEYLSFLKETLDSDLCTVGECLEKFAEADAFSGCSVIFDIMEQQQTRDSAKIKERYDQIAQKRLNELKCEIAQMKKDIYQLSVYSGWLGNDYLTTFSNITMLEGLVKEESRDLTMLCTSVEKCSDSVKCLIEIFQEKLREQVTGNFNREQSRRLYALIERGQYAAVLEWTAHLNITDDGVKEQDFFKDRYFNSNIYKRKEKSLLQPKLGIKDKVSRLKGAIMNTTSWEGFDFNRVPGGIGNRRVQLISLWFQVKSMLPSITKSGMEENATIFNDLEQILKALGWDVIEMEKRCICEDESSGYLQFDMRFRMTYSRDRCPIPLFGSDSGGRIRIICLHGSTNAPDKLYDLYENKSEQIPMIMLLFGVMTYERRMELYRLALERQSAFLLVDDVIITTICERRETIPLRWLYALAVPFSVQTMYTAALGIVYPEMFYGRTTAKSELGLKGKVCAVYGGRQLGKTALLKNIKSEQHNPETDHFVYYISLPTVKVEHPETVLAKEIVNTIGDEIPIERKCENTDEILEGIREWIQEKETRRLLLLLDEADEFLLADGKNGFRLIGNINRIMTVSDLRFKVVFAGLHNVYRSISLPNNPLAHYGKPISIGPLLDDELQDAINLIRQPFGTMGYRFESLDLIIWILAETNYYPSLIQLFCMKLQDYLQQPKNRKKRGKALPVMICREDIDSVLKDPSLKKSIFERFMWTLDLDDRYKAIVLSIAFDVGHASKTDLQNDFVKGFDIQWIYSEIAKWPNLFKEHSSLDELRGLCDELIQLGILRSVSNDRYTLRSVNILDMLGTQESILRKMYELESRHYDYGKMYNGTLYRSFFHDKENGCKCYPLTSQQIHSALDTGGIKLLVGSHALGIGSIEKCLQELLALDIKDPSVYDLYQQKKYMLHVHADRFPNFGELGGSLSIHLVHWECVWEMQDLKIYKQELDALKEQERPVILVLCDETKSRWLSDESSVDALDVPVIRLARWDLEAVQFWLNESSAPLFLMDDLIQIMERLCGWPAAMYRLWNLMEKRRESGFDQSILEETVTSLEEDPGIFGFLPEQDVEPLLHAILDIYAEFETDMTCEDIRYILEEENSSISMEHIIGAMAWMADMGLLNKQIQNKETDTDEIKYRVDPLILELWKKRPHV